MKFSAATIVAFISMSNALPAAQNGKDGSLSSAQPAFVHEMTAKPVTSSTYNDKTQIARVNVQPRGSSASLTGGGLDFGEGLDLESLTGGLLSGGKLPGLEISGQASINLEGVVGSLSGSLRQHGYLDGSGHLDLGGLLDGLKGKLAGYPGGAELGASCAQLKSALSGSRKVDLKRLSTGLEGVLSGSGKFDFGGSLGVDVNGFISGLTLLLEASIKGSGGLDISLLLDQFEAFFVNSGQLDLTVGLGHDLVGVIAGLKDLLLGVSGPVALDIKGVLNVLKGLLNGSINLNGFVAAIIKLPGGDLLASLFSRLLAVLQGLGIDLRIIVKQLVSLLGGILRGTIHLAGSIVAGATLDLSALLNALGQIGGHIVGGIAQLGGRIIHGVVQLGGKIVGSVGDFLSRLFGAH